MNVNTHALPVCAMLAAWGCAPQAAAPETGQDAGADECAAGQTVCISDAVHRCDADGTTGALLQICDLECRDGACVHSCEAAAQRDGNLGCEFWAVDLGNAREIGPAPDEDGQCPSIWAGTAPVDDVPVCHDDAGRIGGDCGYGGDCSSLGDGYACSPTPVCLLDGQRAPFAIVVANPDRDHAVAVTIESGEGMSQTRDVPAGAVFPIYPQALGFPDQSLGYSEITNGAYRITSTAPIVAYQLNPFDDVGVFSNDGSLLLAAHALDTEYYGVTYPTHSRGGPARDFDGYLTVVATAPGETMVTVDSAGHVRSGGIDSMQPGQQRAFALRRFQTLTLAAAGGAPGEPGSDLTGTRIVADRPIAVFGGHEGAFVEDGGAGGCCLDHLETQLIPTTTWGAHYAIARSRQRSLERDMLRIMAQRSGTVVDITPPGSGSCPVLDAGTHCDVFIEGDTVVSASDPILVTHYLTAVAESGPASGDPSMTLAVPTAQHRRTYSFLVPEHYANNYASIVARAGDAPKLDGQDIGSQLAPFGDGYAGGRIPLEAGQHRLDCAAGCGLMVHGWSHKVSYMFAGGLDLERIAVP